MMRFAPFLLLAACVAAGCGAEGSAESSGNTTSLYKEIAPPKENAPRFIPPGHSLMKGDAPGSQSVNPVPKGRR